MKNSSNIIKILSRERIFQSLIWHLCGVNDSKETPFRSRRIETVAVVLQCYQTRERDSHQELLRMWKMGKKMRVMLQKSISIMMKLCLKLSMVVVIGRNSWLSVYEENVLELVQGNMWQWLASLPCKFVLAILMNDINAKKRKTFEKEKKWNRERERRLPARIHERVWIGI